MTRILTLLALIAAAVLLIRARWQRWQRKRRGEPEPEIHGPKPVTWVIVAIVLIYGLLIGYQLLWGTWAS